MPGDLISLDLNEDRVTIAAIFGQCRSDRCDGAKQEEPKAEVFCNRRCCHPAPSQEFFYPSLHLSFDENPFETFEMEI